MIRKICFLALFLILSSTCHALSSEEISALRSKLGQMFAMYVTNQGSSDGYIPANLKNFIQRNNIGGVILENSKTICSEKLAGSTDLELKKCEFEKSLSEIAFDLTHSTLRDLFVVEDYYLTNEGMNFFNRYSQVPLPKVSSIGEFGDPWCSFATGYLSGLQMRSFGYNVMLGPIVEIFDYQRFNLKLSPQDKQSNYFGEDVERVQTLASYYLSGLAKSKMAPTLKHFPFDTNEVDTHDSLAVSQKTQREIDEGIETFECLNYELCQRSTVPAWIMTTHTLYPSVDPENIATFSPTWIKLARKIMGEDSLIVTDSLLMGGLYSNVKKSEKSNARNENTLRALLAGHDILLFTGSTQTMEAYDYVLAKASENTESGKILREKIGVAFQRIQRYKKSHPALFQSFRPLNFDYTDLALHLNDAVLNHDQAACKEIALQVHRHSIRN